MSDLRQYEVWSQTKAFARHVDSASEILRRGASHGSLIVSLSWGKDSIAMGALALEVIGRVPMLHLASPYALPGYDETREWFEARTDVHVVPASRSLAEYVAWCKNVGLPHERTRSAHAAVVKNIKRDRSAEWVAEHGFAVVCLGMRIAEKGPRAAMLRARGPVYQLVDGTWRCNPLTYWTNDDVWAFIASRGLPYNHRLYDAETHGLTRETIRNTGWLSTDGAERGRCAWLRQHFPEQWQMLVDEFPQVRIMS